MLYIARGPLGDDEEQRSRNDMQQRLVRALLLFALLLTSSVVAAQERDGHWWNERTEMEKLTYVVGIFDGLEYSANIQTLPGLEAMADPKTGKFGSVSV